MVKQIIGIKQVVTERDDFPIKRVTNSVGLAYRFMDEIGNLTQENLVLLCLNSQNEVLSYSTISIGTLNKSIAHPRDIFQRAILSNSARIILLHNHPSNNCEPSTEDIHLTERVSEAGEILGIALLDHIIVGRNTYYSFREENVLIKIT